MTQCMECHERVTKVFRDVFDDPQLTIRDEFTASDIPGWDSLAQVNIIVSLEEEFDVTFSTAEVASFTCVGDVKTTILARSSL